MFDRPSGISRRGFLKVTATSAAATAVAPTIVPSSALGRDGFVPPSERIVVGGIGIGRRGGYDLGCFLQQKDVQFVAVADVKQKRRREVKKNRGPSSRSPGLRRLPRFSRAVGPPGY